MNTAVSTVLALILAAPALCQVTPWTPEDVIKQVSVRSMTVSPDGTKAAWIKTVADMKGDRYVSRLHLTDLPTGKSRRLVYGDAGESSPQWSPDGTRLAYSSSRKPAGDDEAPKGSQVWILRMDGGEPRPVTAVEGGVRGFRWIDDGTLLVSARERKSPAEREEEKRKDKSIAVEDEARFREQAVRLFTVKLSDDGKGKLQRVTSNDDRVQGFEVSPDGRWVVYTRGTSPVVTDTKSPARVFLRSLASGDERELFTDRRNRPGQFAWRKDSKVVFAIVPHSKVDGEASGHVRHVYSIDATSGATKQVRLGWDRGVSGTGFTGTKDGFLAFCEDGVRYRPARYRFTTVGWAREPLTGVHADRLFGFAASTGSDRIVYVHGSAQDPDHWCHARLDGSKIVDENEFMRPHASFEKRPLARREIIRWKGAEGDEVEGILYFPVGYQEGKKYPLIAMPHGGPHGADRDRFSQRYAYLPHFYAERGAFCLFMNYHGSSSYGLEWSESIKGRYYELEVTDILAGIDAQVKAGRVDPDQLGLAGWSNGAILAIACLTHAEDYAKEYAHYRFKACVPGAGDVNWTSDYGNCRFGVRFDDYYLGGPPWKLTEVYLEKSPLFRVEKVTTPTLIFFGDKDTAVPTEQGWQWYRALQQVGKAPVRFVLFPGQPHGLNKPSFRRRKIVEELRWFDRYLFETEEKPVAKVDESSPLGDAIAAASYARDGVAYGRREGDVLVPETVALDGVEIGRFEVTRAQWKSVFPDTPVEPGEENLPMTGVSLDQARDYVKRLSARSDGSYRLPTEQEFGKLPKGPDENTLDWWIGFKPSPADARRFRVAAGGIPTVGGLPPLVRAVGERRPGRGHVGARVVRVHDVGGNLGEWVTTADGGGKLAGGFAYGASDDRADARVMPAYAGLRVVRER